MHFPLAEIKDTSASENSLSFSVSKDVHVNETVKTLKNGEKKLFELIGQMTRESEDKGDAAGVTSGELQAGVPKSDLNIGYTYFYEYMKKLEELRLVDLVRRDGVHGRMSYVEVRGVRHLLPFHKYPLSIIINCEASGYIPKFFFKFKPIRIIC